MENEPQKLDDVSEELTSSFKASAAILAKDMADELSPSFANISVTI